MKPQKHPNIESLCGVTGPKGSVSKPRSQKQLQGTTGPVLRGYTGPVLRGYTGPSLTRASGPVCKEDK